MEKFKIEQWGPLWHNCRFFSFFFLMFSKISNKDLIFFFLLDGNKCFSTSSIAISMPLPQPTSLLSRDFPLLWVSGDQHSAGVTWHWVTHFPPHLPLVAGSPDKVIIHPWPLLPMSLNQRPNRHSINPCGIKKRPRDWINTSSMETTQSKSLWW